MNTTGAHIIREDDIALTYCGERVTSSKLCIWPEDEHCGTTCQECTKRYRNNDPKA